MFNARGKGSNLDVRSPDKDDIDTKSYVSAMQPQNMGTTPYMGKHNSRGHQPSELDDNVSGIMDHYSNI